MSARDDRVKSVKDVWSKQAIAELGDDPIAPGVDYLRSDFTAIDVPSHLVSCWAPADYDLSNRGYFKADPQPKNHTMVRDKKHVLWLTRKDLYDAQKAAEREYFNARHRAPDDEGMAAQGAAVITRDGKSSMAAG